MLRLPKRAERQAHMQRFQSVGNIGEHSKHLPGWPRNNTAHLETAPLGSGPSDGWGDLSRTSSRARRQGPNQSPPRSSLTYAHPGEDPQRSRVLSRHLKLLILTLDHRKANVIILSVCSLHSLLSFSPLSCGNVKRD